MFRRLLLIVALLFIGAGLFGAWFVNAAWLSQADAGAPIDITVEQGMTARAVRDVLVSQKLVSSFGYGLYTHVDVAARKPKAGTYALRRGMSYAAIARVLATGPTRDEVVVRLIEGKTLNDERTIVEGLGGEPGVFTALAGASRNEAPFDRSLIEDYPFLSSIPANMSLEGYAFPDTYRVWKDHMVDSLVRKQLDEFSERVAVPYAEAQRTSGMSWHEVVTLASIVEAEVRTPEDRKIVAGIFLNRLKDGMRLQSDATLNYVIGEGRARATNEDLASTSPYNTYQRDGLPPGPVGNPSLSSLAAVLEPTKTNYYFFLTDEKGKVYYARNHEEHIQNRFKAFGQ